VQRWGKRALTWLDPSPSINWVFSTEIQREAEGKGISHLLLIWGAGFRVWDIPWVWDAADKPILGLRYPQETW